MNSPNDMDALKGLEKVNIGKRYIEVIPIDNEDFLYIQGNVV